MKRVFLGIWNAKPYILSAIFSKRSKIKNYRWLGDMEIQP